MVANEDDDCVLASTSKQDNENDIVIENIQKNVDKNDLEKINNNDISIISCNNGTTFVNNSSTPSNTASNVFTRKKRLLQSLPTQSEQIIIKRKSETNDLQVNEPAKQKYETFKPTVKMPRKEINNNVLSNVTVSNLLSQTINNQNDSIAEIPSSVIEELSQKTTNIPQACSIVNILSEKLSITTTSSINNMSEQDQNSNDSSSRESSNLIIDVQIENNDKIQLENDVTSMLQIYIFKKKRKKTFFYYL